MAKVGTPENPEVLDPRDPRDGEFRARDPWRPSAPVAGRVRTAIKLLRSLAFVLAPAGLLDWAVITLFHDGWTAQNPVPVLMGLLLLGPAALCTLLAAIAGPLLFLSLVFSLFGRSTSFRARTFGRPAARSF